MPFGVLKEIAYPQYRDRHIFTAKLRLVVFLVFWFLYVFFMKDWMEETRLIAIIVSLSFLVTTFCYYNVYRGRLILASLIGEVASDVVAMTAIIYLTGGPESTYFTVYIFYVIICGMLYNHMAAAFAAVASLIVYIIFTLLCYAQIIPPLLVAMDGMITPAVRSPYFHPLMLLLFFVLAVYTTKIAHHFTQVRERMLETRNRELTALHQMSNTIKSMNSLKTVLDEVLQGALQGLDFTLVLLMLFDKETKTLKCHPPKGSPIVKEIEKMLSFPLENISLPVNALENTAFRSLKQGQIVFRREAAELIKDVKPPISAEGVTKIQERFGVKKIVAVPLVVEGGVIGSLFGFATTPFVSERKVETFESFANQAAMAIQTVQLIDKLQKKNSALQEANRVKSEFLATMSHELRTPLTAIIGFSELLMEGVMGELTNEQKESMKEVLNNGANLLEMINNLLDLAKIDSGKMKINVAPFDVADLLQRVANTIASLIQRKRHDLSIDIQTAMPPLVADEKRIQQVVLNLLANAIKFTPDGGQISITARYWPTQAAAERAGCAPKRGGFKGALYYISVSDTGIGIKEEHLESIFDVFSQVDSGATRSYEGTGLGLALARQFVELHGGRIWAESSPGKGATFTFVLPAKT